MKYGQAVAVQIATVPGASLPSACRGAVGGLGFGPLHGGPAAQSARLLTTHTWALAAHRRESRFPRGPRERVGVWTECHVETRHAPQTAFSAGRADPWGSSLFQPSWHFFLVCHDLGGWGGRRKKFSSHFWQLHDKPFKWTWSHGAWCGAQQASSRKAGQLCQAPGITYPCWCVISNKAITPQRSW